MDKFTGRSRGFGFVEMSNDQEGQAAIDKLDKAEYEGKVISVSVARPREDKKPGGDFNQNRRYNSNRFDQRD
jgi:RNA recognition motif-containing protein